MGQMGILTPNYLRKRRWDGERKSRVGTVVVSPAACALGRISIPVLRTRLARHGLGPLKAPSRSRANPEPKQTRGLGAKQGRIRLSSGPRPAGKSRQRGRILPDATQVRPSEEPRREAGRAEGSGTGGRVGTHPAGGKAP